MCALVVLYLFTMERLGSVAFCKDNRILRLKYSYLCELYQMKGSGADSGMRPVGKKQLAAAGEQ